MSPDDRAPYELSTAARDVIALQTSNAELAKRIDEMTQAQIGFEAEVTELKNELVEVFGILGGAKDETLNQTAKRIMLSLREAGVRIRVACVHRTDGLSCHSCEEERKE